MIQRVGARAVLLTPENRILLMNIVEPRDEISFWITPGGGLDPGESAEEGLLRELMEEVGRNDFDLESAIWTRTSRFKWDGQDYQQDETYFLVSTEEFDVGEGGEMDGEDERAVVKAFRWWNADEILDSSETFAPRELGDLLGRLITDGPPDEPIHTGQ